MQGVKAQTEPLAVLQDAYQASAPGFRPLRLGGADPDRPSGPRILVDGRANLVGRFDTLLLGHILSAIPFVACECNPMHSECMRPVQQHGKCITTNLMSLPFTSGRSAGLKQIEGVHWATTWHFVTLARWTLHKRAGQHVVGRPTAMPGCTAGTPAAATAAAAGPAQAGGVPRRCCLYPSRRRCDA